MIDALNSLVLPDALGMERSSQRVFADTTNFDYRTLIYDAIYIPRRRAICLICPKLRNLSRVIGEAQFFAGGRRLTPKIRVTQGRHDEVWFRCLRTPDTLKIRYHSFDWAIPVSLQDRTSFKGLRCAVLKSKDNELTWIKDWAKYHVKVHNLQAVLLFDNASKRYSVGDVHDALLQTGGLQQVRVLLAPFPFGPVKRSEDRGGKGYSTEKFLSHGILNIARRRYLQQAASVLLTDIDELVSPVPNSSIFRLAESSLFGYVEFKGVWRYPREDADEVRHLDHVYGDGTTCKSRKYCISPRGLFRYLQWSVHNVHGASKIRSIMRKYTVTRKVEFWHCRRVTTGWKKSRDIPPAEDMVRDAKTENTLRQVFGMNSQSLFA